MQLNTNGRKKHSENTFAHVKEATGKKETELMFPLVFKMIIQMRPDFEHCRHLTHDEQTSFFSV